MSSLKEKIQTRIKNKKQSAPTKEQTQAFDQYLGQVRNADTVVDLKTAAAEVITEGKKLGKDKYMFNYEQNEEFWQVYNVKKEEFMKEQYKVHEEYKKLLKESLSVQELEAIKAVVCKEASFTWDEYKKPVRDKCDELIKLAS